ncbi:lytic murein transglycosylase [Methylorubrum populi BJ001]|uniref:Lytic murein transglycosylase n=1 Tax=Methylorubrum populi (strain ATCC BAA-705 / NCIMB 13946 / BJ001) TaxID=441620 RepID=B1ZKQ0_METPB|nr:lytic murein transglycosylase [Methylorubrum populi]ACB81620.1 lytic murein transglycosylase [Methylorubrum populi BJ001]OAH34830.1 lytic transglycosylase [Methylorubrum populi]PZP72608.1 MAG: lytic murein transglycosylase [Methylorubrum populi]
MRTRRAVLALPLCLALLAAPGPAWAQDGDFPGFVASLRSDAIARGVSPNTFDAAFAGLRGPDPDVIARTRRQGEFSRPVWDYLVGAVSPGRIARGQAQGKRLAATLAAIEAKTGVPRAIVLAFWGVESDFGASAGSLPTVRALASLAYVRHRGTLFRDELLAALQILEKGDIEPARMVGSWAGAMGQVQFLPSVYLREAVDFDGDGRRDIWRSEPDALASIAHYLRSLGWKPGLSWGYEVSLPKEFDLTRYRGPLADFAARGVRRTDGKPLPVNGEASLFLPGGLGSPVFLITDNFEVIRGYNTSDSYALAVGHLADRLAGGPALAAPWPNGDARLDGPGLKRLQAGLAAQGLYAGEQDGRAGPKLREAVRQYQIREGLPADGYARPALLERLERLEGRP